MEKPNSGMYVPLHYSNLYKAVPEGEEILYSLFTKVILMGRDVNFQGQKKIWHSHLLITTKGMYFGKYQRTRQPITVFISWLMVKKVRGNKIKTIKPQYTLKPKRERNFETKERYQIRKKELAINLQNILQQGKKIILKEFIEQENLYSIITQRERFLLKFLLEDQYIDDFDKVVVSILHTRYIIGNDRIEPRTYYVDIKKKKISNQINSVSIEIIAFLPLFLIFFFLWIPLRINPWDSLGVSMSLLGIIYSVFLILDRLRIRRVNFKIPQFNEFPLKEGKEFQKYIEYKEKSLENEFKNKRESQFIKNTNYENRNDYLKQSKERFELLEQKFKKMKEEQLKRHAETINKLLEMDVHGWEQYLENTIKKIERTLKFGLDYFERKKSLTTYNIYQFSSLEDTLENRKNLLNNLKIDNSYISKIKERIKLDYLSFQRENTKKITPFPKISSYQKFFIDDLLKMNSAQIIKLLKTEILITQKLIDREALKRVKTNNLADLEKRLIQSTLDIENLEKDRTNIDLIKKRLINDLNDEDDEYTGDESENFYT